MTIQECIDKWKDISKGECQSCNGVRYYSGNYKALCMRHQAATEFIKDLEDIQKYEEAKLKRELSKAIYTNPK